jgi:hypothetical protein
MFYPIFIPQRETPMDYIKTTFSLLVTTLYYSKNNNFNVVLLSIDHFSRKHDVATRFSPSQGKKRW